ncbi:MAG TPA: signal peptide peptidase SppA [Kofleriaceae bacterium]|nr:signal peptide peptidase SppA [Kofleriaceae bacterium]
MPTSCSVRVAGLLLLIGAAAHAQPVDRRYAEEPTAGVELPATPLAGDQDARAVSANPAGVWWLGGPSFALVAGLADQARADSAGAGVGIFAASTIGGGFLPKVGWGWAVEWLRPPRSELVPDPGAPVRFTIAESIPLATLGSFGASWHHFSGDGALGGTNAFDLGFSGRFGNAWDLGAVLRDLNAPVVDGMPTQRRYELELGWRPLETDRLAFSAGGRVGETRGDLDGWFRADVKVARGVYVHAQVDTRALHVLETTATGTIDRDDRDLRGTIGLQLDFGHTSVVAWGMGGADRERDARAVAGAAMLRWQYEKDQSLLPPEDRIERVELTSALGPHALVGIVMRLRAMERDPHVKAVVFALDGAGGGMASLQEIRDGIKKLRAAGKKTYAYMVNATGRDYWVASACDRIYLDPGGGVRLVGMAGTTLYFKGLFDQLGVQAQFEKIAEYKSAPESWTETGPTEPALRMRNELYDSIWNQIANGIAEGRKLDRKTVDEIVANGPYTAGDAIKDKRIADFVGEPEGVSADVVKDLGAAYEVSGPPGGRSDRWAPPQIAVVFIHGDIVDGPSRTLPVPLPFLGQEMAGSETITAAISAARGDPRVKAIVVRIDSPGGSALASDLIAREIKKTRGVKPIICSMGDVAASGGYYVAAYCDTILAEPTTITGSIGIFYGKFDVSGLLEKLGVTTETFKRGARSDMESFFRPYTDEERTVVHDKLRYLYERFTGAVAEGRKLTPQQVDDVGRGHVWSGEQAVPIKLVDQLGGFSEALDLAKARAGLSRDDEITLVELPRAQTSFLAQVLGWFGIASEKAPLPLGWTQAIVDALPASILAEPDVPQARLDFNVSWN